MIEIRKQIQLKTREFLDVWAPIPSFEFWHFFLRFNEVKAYVERHIPGMMYNNFILIDWDGHRNSSYT